MCTTEYSFYLSIPQIVQQTTATTVEPFFSKSSKKQNKRKTFLSQNRYLLPQQQLACRQPTQEKKTAVVLFSPRGRKPSVKDANNLAPLLLLRRNLVFRQRLVLGGGCHCPRRTRLLFQAVCLELSFKGCPVILIRWQAHDERNAPENYAARLAQKGEIVTSLPQVICPREELYVLYRSRSDGLRSLLC